MLKRIVIISLAIVLTVLTSCSSSSNAVRGSIYIQQKYETQFNSDLAKYDEALAKAHNINEQLTAVETNLDSLPKIAGQILANLQTLSAGTAAGAGASIEDAQKKFAEYSNNPEKIIEALQDRLLQAKIKVVVTIDEKNSEISAKIELSGLKPEQDTSVADKIKLVEEQFKQIFEPALKIKKDMEKLGKESKDLAILLKNLGQSASTDFSGMNALKAPTAIKTLGAAANQMTEVPGKIEKIAVKLPGVITGLSKLAAM